MTCFYHQDASAVGLCKSCNKGLCATCAVDVGNGLACQASCVERVRSLNQLVERNIRLTPASEQLLGKQPRGYLLSGVFGIVAGGLFMMLGQNMDGVFRIGITGIGAMAGLLGIWQTYVWWRLRDSAKSEE